MRRKRIRAGRRRSLRKGVTARVATIKRRVQLPVKCCRYSTGLAVRSRFHVRQPIQASGARPRAKTATLIQRLRMGSVVLPQVHALVEGGDPIAVAVEGEGGAAAELAQAVLGGLAPAGMVDGGVHVGVEAVFPGVRQVPGG